ncbi:thioesterase [Nocardioides sp. Soil797]|nr:thioesterase [Nocardioides sp. Soil797]
MNAEEFDPLLGATSSLVTATRELMLAVATTEASTEELRAARDAIAAVSASLCRSVRPRVQRMDFDLPARIRDRGPQAHWQTYELNPFGIPLRVHFDGDAANAELRANALHEGPPDHVHGGMSAHLMDCMLGGLVQATGTRSVTATLDLRFIARTPLDEPLQLGSRIVERSGRKVWAEGWIEHRGTRCVEAKGLFLSIAET